SRLFAERRRRNHRAVRQLPRVAWLEDACAEDGAPLRQRARPGALAHRAARSRARSLPGAALASAACARATPDARVWRHGDDRAQSGPRGNQTLSGTLPPLRARRKPWRRGKPDRASGLDDARLDSGSATRDAGNRRFAGATVGGHRRRRRPATRPPRRARRYLADSFRAAWRL